MTTSPRPAADPPFHILFDQPQIPPNTGNAIRMCAGTGAALHLAGPLGFNFEEKHVRRAGLDYHDLAEVQLHEDFEAAATHLTGLSRKQAELSRQQAADGAPPRARVFAFTTHAETWFTDVGFRRGDVLLFGPEPTGLDEATLADPRITAQLRIPMLPARRSMNLSNAAAVAAYEAWRQLGFPGGQ
ncbi:tRNA (cytidine(34)-2'-O)-methyltransferase [Corynebacterium sp. UMB9976]|uniref:tRNA (cytidine(34)-2'-O)-methyltransferase n=1 Tax=Corynebacterium sp. UMB9976 TaxID=3046354 RepID=UPI00254EB7DF|nr:tRNA (cytidine(34)-2'-O)-methyltransferase [Corynebacterium sp. UMB9976]MDK6301603.1 tRNA (cytidine(34)-2'-O)-methyltransferase [Corynebacterium sp. UMB9976]